MKLIGVGLGIGEGKGKISNKYMLEKQKTNQFPAEARQDMPDKREFRG